MNDWKKSARLALAPLLFSVYPVLFMYGANIGQLQASVLVRPLLVSLVGVFLLLLLFSLLLRSLLRGAMLTNVLSIAFFSYGHVWLVLERNLPVHIPPLDWHNVLLPLYLSLIATGIMATLRARQRRLESALKYLSLVSGLLVLLSIFNIGWYSLRNRPSRAQIQMAIARTEPVHLPSVPADPPDVYYIILDAYSRADVMRDYYGFDNSEFITYLEDRGFYVASESRANYPFSFLSMTSSLNMTYLDLLPEVYGEDGTDRTLPYTMLAHQRVGRTLQAAGYRYIHFSTGWLPTDTSPIADQTETFGFYYPEFERLLLHSTLLNLPITIAVDHEFRTRATYNFAQVAEVSALEEPTYVFAHFFVPHEPYMFGPEDIESGSPSVDGHIIDPLAVENLSPDYTSQVMYVNRQVQHMVDQILAQSATPPIIIIQGDHGNWTEEAKSREWGAAEMARYVSPIFNAYYVPPDAKEQLYPSISPVNSFRLIFKTVYGADLDLLPDIAYYADPVYGPYRFEDVTSLSD